MKNYLSIQLVIKKVFDWCLGLILLMLLWPVFVLIAVAIKLDSRGPVFFKQMRVGQNQRQFECYKFRSMYCYNDESIHRKLIEQLMTQDKEQKQASIIVYEKINVKRITRCGRILRKFKLDELPQIWNVVKGDMSFVGPRPAIDYEIKYHNQNMLRRFNVKSGLTGLWQINSGRSIDYKNMVTMDLYYVDHWSLLLDFKIILKTISLLCGIARKP